MNYSQMTMSVFEKNEALASPRAIPDMVMSPLAEYTLLVLAIFFVRYYILHYLDSRVSRTGYLSPESVHKANYDGDKRQKRRLVKTTAVNSLTC
jgi:hypothetical protein